MLLKILAVVVLLVIGLVLFIATRPAGFRYTRSAVIAASPQTLFQQIDDLRQFQNWNPWAMIDPNVEITYAGPPTGVGSSYTWKGNREVGEGTMTIIESKPGELVKARMDFRQPFAATHTAEFAFKPENGGTRVSWTLHGDNNFMGKAIGLFIDCDKMCGDQFEKGLTHLKTLMETAPES